MFNVLKRSFLDKKWQMLIYGFSGAALLWMYIAFFPAVQKSAADVSKVVKSLPPSLIKSFGLDAKSFTTFNGFVAGKHFSLIWPILLIALLASLAASFLAGEIEKKTIMVPLSQPVSRLEIFLEKSLVGVGVLIFFIVTSVMSVFPMAEIYNISYASSGFLKLALVGFVFGLAIFGLAMFFSAIFSEKSKVTFSVVGILLFMYFMNIVSALKPSLDKLKYISFFHYFNYTDILIHSSINNWSFLMFLGTFVVAGTAGLIWFQKRDIVI